MERLLTIEEKGNEIIEMCREHRIIELVFEEQGTYDLANYIRNNSGIIVTLQKHFHTIHFN